MVVAVAVAAEVVEVEEVATETTRSRIAMAGAEDLPSIGTDAVDNKATGTTGKIHAMERDCRS